jgi:hypothetical protein
MARRCDVLYAHPWQGELWHFQSAAERLYLDKTQPTQSWHVGPLCTLYLTPAMLYYDTPMVGVFRETSHGDFILCDRPG